MAKTFESKGKEGRWGSGGVVEAEGGGSWPLYRCQEWGAWAPPVVVVVSETTPLMGQN
jgi:hypothetical protein